MTTLQAIILAIIEGITEFLPISSTGHMIIASSMMGISADEFTKLFTICIQFGAILSVVILYWKRFFTSIEFYIKLLVAFTPAAVIGLLFSKKIDMLLESPLVVAINLVIGGIILLFVDNYFSKPTIDTTNISYPKALKIGFFQCIAMMPGVSRSAATIIGGLYQGMTRKAAAEFSFFLAVPTMLAATGYKLLKGYNHIQAQHINLLIVGNIVAFIVAIIAIKFLIGILTKYGFKFFGYYRIILGLAIIAMIFMGIPLEIV